jgi:hypothetical protein
MFPAAKTLNSRPDRCGLAFVAPGDYEDKSHTGANGTVGYVECGKAHLATALLHIKIEKIDDMPSHEAIKQVADDSTENQAKRYLTQQSA